MMVDHLGIIGLIPIILYNGKGGKYIGDIYYSFYALHFTDLIFIQSSRVL